jgi:hypothetical protein
MLNKLIKCLGAEDYFYVINPKSEYNTTGKYELHSLNSEKPLVIGYLRILKVLIDDYVSRKAIC